MNKKKLIAPIIITGILISYLLVYLIIAFITPMPLWTKIVFGFIPLCFIGVSIFVLMERVEEIRKGEEDDISKY